MTSFRKWVHGAASAAITGLSSSFLSALGIAGANLVGIKVEQLQPKQLLFTTLMGGAIGAAAYFKQSPLWQDDNDNNTKA